MYAARKNRIRLRTTLLIMILAMVAGAILTLALMQQEITRLRQASFNASQTSDQKVDWVEMFSAFGEEVIQTFISMTSDTYWANRAVVQWDSGDSKTVTDRLTYCPTIAICSGQIHSFDLWHC